MLVAVYMVGQGDRSLTACSNTINILMIIITLWQSGVSVYVLIRRLYVLVQTTALMNSRLLIKIHLLKECRLFEWFFTFLRNSIYTKLLTWFEIEISLKCITS